MPNREPEPEPGPEPPENAQHLNEYQRRVARRTLHLLDLGFSLEQVLRLDPARLRFDWHDAERLIRRGCLHETAVQILEED